MKVLLIKLPMNPDNRYDFEQLVHPYGLASISSYLKSNNQDVTLLDAQAHKMLRNEITDYINNLNPNIIGFSSMTCNLPIIESFLPDIKKVNPNVKIVIGGPHPSAEPKSTLQNNSLIDYVVRGEGEISFLELLDTLKNNQPLDNISGIGYRNNGEVLLTNPRPPISDLDSLPYSDWNSLPMNKYFAHTTTKKNYARVFASRGCPFDCTFCAVNNIMGKKVRKRSPVHFVNEIKYLYDHFHVRDLGIGDSTFNIDQDWMIEICEEIIKLNRPIIWRCNCRAKNVSLELAKIMKKSGCVHVTMGMESGDPKMLSRINKGQTLDDFRRAVDIFQKINIDVLNSFIIGLPGETLESIENTLLFMKELKKSECGFNLAIPLPGSQFYEIAKHEGQINKDVTTFDATSISYVPEGMTEEQLIKAFNRITKSYYFRPTHIYRTLKSINSLLNLKIYLRSAYRLLRRRMNLNKCRYI